MMYPERFGSIRSLLKESDFEDALEGAIFGAFEYYHSIGVEADITLISQRLSDTGIKCNNSYLSGLTTHVGLERNLEGYCRVVKEKSLRRQFKAVLERYLGEADNPKTKSLTKDFVAETMKSLVMLDTFLEDRYDMDGALDAFMAHLREPVKLSSLGFSELDGATGGGVPMHGLVTLCSDSGGGKTTTMINMAVNKALLGDKVLLISLELNIIDLLNGIIPQLSDLELSVEYNRLKRAGAEEAEEIFSFVKERLAELNIYFAFNCDKFEELIAVMDMHRIDFGVNSVFIDHAGLIEGAEDYQRYTLITKTLKKYPIKYKCPVFLLSQTNNNRNNRANKDPNKSDVRGGENLFNDSDVVVFLYKIDHEDEQAYMKLGKNRHGDSNKPVYYETEFDERYRRIGLKRLTYAPKKKEDATDVRKRKKTYRQYESADSY